MATRIVPLPSSGAHAYLLRSETTSILVDTGTEKLGEQTLAACHHTGVKLILLTHAHFDHCQNAAYFSRELGCPVAVSREDAPLLTSGEQRPVKGEGLFGSAYARVSNWSIRKNSIPSVTPQVFLEDGMSLAPWGIEGKVVSLPGHTAGSVGVLLDSRELLAGDAMSGLLRPGPAWCYEDKAQMEKSLEKILALKARRIYMGHGLIQNSQK